VALLNLNGRARVREFLPDGLGFLFGNAFFYRFGGRFDQILRFFQTQGRDFAATAAAAETPKVSSISFTNSEASSKVSSLI
jgi:hypothetical protein